MLKKTKQTRSFPVTRLLQLITSQIYLLTYYLQNVMVTHAITWGAISINVY